MQKPIVILSLTLSAGALSSAQSQFGVNRLEVEGIIDDLSYSYVDSYLETDYSYTAYVDVDSEGLGVDIRYSTPWIEKRSWGVDVSGSARLVDYDITLDYTIDEVDGGEEYSYTGRLEDSFKQYGVYLGAVYYFKASGFTPFAQADVGYFSTTYDDYDESGLGWRGKAGVAIQLGELSLTPRYQIFGIEDDDTRTSYGLEASLRYNQGLIVSGAYDRVDDLDFEGDSFSFKATILY